MDQAEVRGIARAMLEAAGYDEGARPSARQVLEGIWRPGCIVRTTAMPGAPPASLSWLRSEPLFQVRGRHPAEAERFMLFHEGAHAWFRREGRSGADTEAVCNAVAAALVTPSRAFASVVRDVGEDLPELARRFVTTESVVALRLGEVLYEPVALVTPHSVHARGPEDWAWPDEATVRRVARNGRPGIRRTKITDARGRVVLRPAVAA